MKLTGLQLVALEECAEYRVKRKPYSWRRASMEKLEAMGLVERHANVSNRRLDQFVPTQAGLEHLSGFPLPAPPPSCQDSGKD